MPSPSKPKMPVPEDNVMLSIEALERLTMPVKVSLEPS
jgi:hypothetical protein